MEFLRSQIILLEAPALPIEVALGLLRAYRFRALIGGVVAFSFSEKGAVFSEKGTAEDEGKITIRFS